MPRRTNTFQDVVAIVRRHMAPGADVEESAMVPPTGDGDPREVDVLITSTVAGHTVRVAVEASKTGRPATVEWVERMIGKHDDLPTDKLVLYSGTGYSTNALKKATKYNVATVAAEEMTDEEREAAVLGGLRSVWPKTYHLQPQRGRVWVERPDGSTVWFRAPGDLALYREDGSKLEVPLKDAIVGHLRRNHQAVAEQLGLRDIAESTQEKFVAVWESPRIDDAHVFARYQEGDAPAELHRITRVMIEGDATIEVTRVDLEHARLGSVSVSYGDVTLAGKAGLLVATGTPEEGTLTLRFPDE